MKRNFKDFKDFKYRCLTARYFEKKPRRDQSINRLSLYEFYLQRLQKMSKG